MLVFTDRPGELTWRHDLWDNASETAVGDDPTALDCRPARGEPRNSLFVLNHFVTAGAGNPELARTLNQNQTLVDRTVRCLAERGRLPNFVAVDFYDQGDVFVAVAALNGP